jgi:hypothetical protein
MKFLFHYRNTPNINTNKKPSELVLKKLPKSKLTDLNPILTHVNPNINPNSIPIPHTIFENGESVLVKSVDDKIQKWVHGIVECKISNFIYKVWSKKSQRMYHIDHMKKCINQNVLVGRDKDKSSKEIPTIDQPQTRRSHRTPKPKKLLDL